MNTTRTGKIARLPKTIRDELNQRLANGERGTELVAWLNSQPEVQCIVTEQFGGKPVRAQNLSEWKQGGYQDWLNKQEAMELVRELPADERELKGPDGEPFSDILATWLTARYAVVARKLQKNGELDWKRLRKICGDVSALRRGDHSAQRLKLELDKLEHARKQTEDEMIAQFVRWVRDLKVQELLRKQINSEEAKEVSQKVNESVGQRSSRSTRLTVGRRGEMRRSRIPCRAQHTSHLNASNPTDISTLPLQSAARWGQRALPCAIESFDAAKSSRAQVGRGVLSAPGLQRTSRTVQNGKSYGIRLNPTFENF